MSSIGSAYTRAAPDALTTAAAQKLGERIANPELAETMRLIAEQGPRAFYRGAMAAEMVERVQNHRRPGTLSTTDLADYRPIKRDAVCGPYRVWKICSMPPRVSGRPLRSSRGRVSMNSSGSPTPIR